MTTRVRFMQFCGQRRPNVTLLAEFCDRTWPQVSTRHTNAATIIAEMRRRNLPVSGDTAGYLRSLAKQLAAHKPERANPATLAAVHRAASQMPTECAAILYLMWASASRLTSLLNLRLDDVNDFKTVDDEMSALSITFRTGKTILSTGAYTVRILVPHQVATFLSNSRRAHIFKKAPEAYYAAMRPAMVANNLELRSIRRGALQALAAASFAPADILLMSRHTTVQGLYRYLDDGRHAKWETDKQQAMSATIWKASSASTAADRML